MKKTLFIFFLGLLAGVVHAQNNNALQYFYVGTYTDGESEGIYRYALDPATGMIQSDGLAAMSENPSYLAFSASRDQLVSVQEVVSDESEKRSYLELYDIHSDGSLEAVNRVNSGGENPCFVAVNKDNFVVTANYTSGTVALMQIRNNALSDTLTVCRHKGKGPNAKRQDRPHAHSAYFEPNGNRVFSADLGIDKIMVYELDTLSRRLKTWKTPEIKMSPGSGPRHLAICSKQKTIYVANELLSSVSVVHMKDDGGFVAGATFSTLPADFQGANTCADIHLSPDGRFLYVSNRGLNSIAIFEISGNGSMLTLVGQEPTRGETPRNFTLSPDASFLLVANQNSNNIVSFKRDAKSGKLSFVDDIKANKPVCLLFK